MKLLFFDFDPMEIFPIIYMAIMLFLVGLFVYVMLLVIKALKKYLREDN